MIDELDHEQRWPHDDKWRKVELEESGQLPKHTHLFEAREAWALRGAMGARRPLLVWGEPGTGKTELARAAAEVLRRPLVAWPWTARGEPSDLYYRCDPIVRSTPSKSSVRPSSAERVEGMIERSWLSPGPLWWVFDWDGAERQYAAASVKGARPRPPKPEWNWKPKQGLVLLIDAIELAQPGLLLELFESLSEGGFGVPYLSEPVRSTRSHQPPLIVITTNQIRELPLRFVRRCLVLNLALPEGNALVPWLMQRGQAHFGKKIASKIYERAAQFLVDERNATSTERRVRPGQAEYLDLLRAVLDVSSGDHELQEAILSELCSFVLRKNLGE